MTRPGKIVEQIRTLGANILIDGSRLTIINRDKVPANMLVVIRENGREIALFLESEAAFDERCAIIQYDGCLNRSISEYLTKMLMSNPPDGTNHSDWSWFVGQAAQMIEKSILREMT
jgi:hypothetical protein